MKRVITRLAIDILNWKMILKKIKEFLIKERKRYKRLFKKKNIYRKIKLFCMLKMLI
jgi:hypothetical protein